METANSACHHLTLVEAEIVMRNWSVRVIAVEAWLGNPADPLIWHFGVWDRTASGAMAQARRIPQIPAGARMTAFPAL